MNYRKILFKGKLLTENKYIYGCLIIRNDSYYIGYIDTFNMYQEIIVDSSTIGQWTGLKDKNDNYIFENDNIRWKESDCCDYKKEFDFENHNDNYRYSKMIYVEKSGRFMLADTSRFKVTYDIIEICN